VQADWSDDEPVEVSPGVVVELPNSGDGVANDARVQEYIRDRLQPAADALDSLKKVFFAATTPTPEDGYLAARARYAYELAQSGKCPEEIAQLLMPTPAQIKQDLMTRFGGR